MATFIDFTPSTVSAFSFQFTANGVPYVATVPWIEYAERYHISVKDLAGNQILYRGLVASGPRYAISLNWANGYAVATTSSPHSVTIGQCASIRVYGTGTAFDGQYTVLATGALSLSYILQNDPSVPLPQSGSTSFDQNLLGGVTLQDGTPLGGYLLYHFDTQQFEYGF